MDEAELRALRGYYSGCTIKTVETDVHALIAEVEKLKVENEMWQSEKSYYKEYRQAKAERDELKAENDTFTSCIVQSNTIIADLCKALEKARTYLEERGIRHRGTVGRLEILPMIDKALKGDKNESNDR